MDNASQARNQAITLATGFVRLELPKQQWFKELRDSNGYSMVLLTGSVVQGSKDSFSDIDLFLIVPFENQLKFKLNPEYSASYEGLPVEMSIVSTEKLISDAETKKHIYWWKGAVPVDVLDEGILSFFEKAGSMSEDDVKDHLWNLMALFEMNLVDMERLVERDDSLSFDLNLYDCLRLFCEFMLLSIGISKRFKWYGVLIKQNFPDIFYEIEEVRDEASLPDKLEKLKQLRKYHRQVLTGHGFSEEEVKNWSEYNLPRLLFQRF